MRLLCPPALIINADLCDSLTALISFPCGLCVISVLTGDLVTQGMGKEGGDRSAVSLSKYFVSFTREASHLRPWRFEAKEKLARMWIIAALHTHRLLADSRSTCRRFSHSHFHTFAQHYYTLVGVKGPVERGDKRLIALRSRKCFRWLRHLRPNFNSLCFQLLKFSLTALLSKW